MPLKHEDLSCDPEFPQAPVAYTHGASTGGREGWKRQLDFRSPRTVSLAEWLSSRVCEIWSQGIKTAMLHTPEKCHSRLSCRLPMCAHKYMCPVTPMLTKTCAQTTHVHTFTSVKKGRRIEWSLRIRERISEEGNP